MMAPRAAKVQYHTLHRDMSRNTRVQVSCSVFESRFDGRTVVEDCSAKQIKSGEPIRCKECGHRVMLTTADKKGKKKKSF
jgi:DNA-directed RNA polymerase subunit RPC12/RpoP